MMLFWILVLERMMSLLFVVFLVFGVLMMCRVG